MSRALVCGALAVLAVLAWRQPGGAARIRRWARPSRRRNRRPEAEPIPGPLVLDLVAAVLASGAPVETTLDLVAEAVREYAPGQAQHLTELARRSALAVPESSGRGPAWLQVLDDALLLARDAGVPPAGILVAAAEQERRRRADRQRLAAARLGVKVVLPTGLCLLPAFLLLTVIPMVVALLGGA